METLSMCRICVSDDIPLRSIVDTHLHEVYEDLTKMPFVTEDNRPIVACDECCASLDNCYELRRRCLSSEEQFAQLLRSNVQVDPLKDDVDQKIPLEYVNVEGNQEGAEDERRYNSAFVHSEDVTAPCSFIKMELDIDNEVPEDAAVDQDDTEPYYKYNALGLHTVRDIPLDIVKKAPDDVDAATKLKDIDPTASAASAKKKIRQCAPVSEEHRLTKDNIEESKSETKRAVGDKPIKKNEIVETRAKIDIRLRNNKQNDSTSDHNCAHKEMSENKIGADQSINRSSSNKLKPWSCDTCQKCFRHECHLRIHMRTHTGEKPYECNVCKKCFTNKCSLDNHTRIHTGEKPYQCNVCKRCFIQKCNLDRHTRTHTDEKPYSCDLCTKSFSQNIILDNHMHTHMDEKLYECNVCNKCFKHKTTLYGHMRTHAGKKYPYQCKICEKYFSKKSYLDTHTRTHTDEKPYECNICKKCFKQKISLDIHMRTHTGEKHPFQCNICMKYFSKKWYLNVHTRTHTGDKPYKCNVCMKCFNQKKTLRSHILLKHS